MSEIEDRNHEIWPVRIESLIAFIFCCGRIILFVFGNCFLSGCLNFII